MKEDARETQALVNLTEKGFSRERVAASYIVSELKRALRDYYHRENTEVVIDSDFNSWTVKGTFPDFVKSSEAAEEYFRNTLFIKKRYKAYGRTGEKFTCGYHIVKLHGQFVYYHYIAVDC